MPILKTLLQPFHASLTLPPPSTFADQTIIITGANSGLGFATAQHLLRLGASRLILGVRSLPKGLNAKAQLLEDNTANTGVSIEVWHLDMNSLSSVRDFATRATSSLEHLDTLILNAGLASGRWRVSDEGWEEQIQCNCSEGKRKKGNLVVVGSDVHLDAKFEEQHANKILNALNDRMLWEESKKAGPAERYAVSKLLGIYAALELARLSPVRQGEPCVVVDIVAPGFCKSELLNKPDEAAPFVLNAMLALTGRTLEEGSKTVVDAAARGTEAHGRYLDHQQFANMGDLVVSKRGKETRAIVWREILEVLEQAAPEVSRIAAGKALVSDEA